MEKCRSKYTQRAIIAKCDGADFAASANPASYGEELRMVTRRDPDTGLIKREFYGSPSAWTNQFKSGAMRVQKFKTGARYDHD